MQEIASDHLRPWAIAGPRCKRLQLDASHGHADLSSRSETALNLTESLAVSGIDNLKGGKPRAFNDFDGAPGRTRTPDPLPRRQFLPRAADVHQSA